MKVIGNLTKDAIIRAAVSEGLTFTQAVGTPVDVDTVASTSAKIAFDSSNNKVVVVYTDQGNGYQGRAVVGTVDASNNSISFGSVATFHAAEVQNDHFAVTFDSNSNKTVICFTDSFDSGKGKAIVGTVSGTSISFGSAAQFSPHNTTMVDCTFDSNLNKVVAVFKDQTNSDYGTAVVGTVSGTSISFGSTVVFNSDVTSYPKATFDTSNNKVVITFRKQSTSHATAIVGTVSGTSISFGSATAWLTSAADYQSITFDSTNNKVVVVANSSGGYAAVGTVSGTSISFGSAVAFTAVSPGSAEYNAAAFDSNTGKVVIVYKQRTTDDPALIVGEVSGTSISFGTAITLQGTDNTNGNRGITFDSNAKKIVTVYMDSSDNRNEAVVFQPAGSIATGGTIADGKAVIVNANGTVSTVGTNAASAGSEQASSVSGGSGWVTSGLPSTSAFVGVAQYDSGNSNYGVAIVGTVSGSTITYGTKAQASTMTYPELPNVIGMTSTTFVFVYKNGSSSNRGEARVGTISGTGASATISFGSAVTFEGGQTTLNTVHSVDRLTDTKFVIAFQDASDNGKAKCIIGTVSGTSVSFGSAATFSTANTSLYTSVSALSETKFVAIWSNTPTPEAGKVIIGTVSGTSISYGSAETYDSDRVVRHSVAAVSDSKFVIAYNDNRLSTNYGTAIAGTVSGTSITLGTPVVWRSSAEGNAYPSVVKLTSDSFAIAGLNDDARGSIFEGSLSGTNITFASPIQFMDSANTEFWATLVNDEKVVVGFPSTNLSAIVYTSETSTLTTENFVGFMKGAALDGTNGEILSSCSIARNQTSLTPGQTYFVSPTDGSLSTTAGSPSVTAGTAISNTELIVKG